MALLSSVKVALTNMAPRAKPRALSVSLTHSFQRGVQLCNVKTNTPIHIKGKCMVTHFYITNIVVLPIYRLTQVVTSYIYRINLTNLTVRGRTSTIYLWATSVGIERTDSDSETVYNILTMPLQSPVIFW